MKFVAYLQWISAKHDGMKVQVVAHSMGGLIAIAAMHLMPNLFHSLLLAGNYLQIVEIYFNFINSSSHDIH